MLGRAHQLVGQAARRSSCGAKTPDLVRQECYGLLLAHFAIRGLMHEAAVHVDADLDRLSFLHAVRVIRRTLPFAIAIPPPDEIGLS